MNKKKAPVKPTKIASQGKKWVAPPTRTPLTRSKRKVVDEQLFKEDRSAKRTRKSVAAVEAVIELDEDDEPSSSLKGKKSLVKRTVVKLIKATTSTFQNKIRGKKKNNESEEVDKMIEFKHVETGRSWPTLMKREWHIW